MSLENKAEEMKGKAKILAGKASDDQRLQMEGRAQKLNAKADQLIEQSKRPHTDKHDVPTD